VASPPPAALTAAALDPAGAYALHPDVSLRPEPFGALAYHYGNRRLVFLRSPELVRLVEQLGDHPSLHHTFEALGTPPAARPALCRALHQLRDSEVIRAR